MADRPLDSHRLEWRFDHYVLEGTPLEEDEWISIEFGGTTHYGRYLAPDDPQENRPSIHVYRNSEPKGTLRFPPEVTTVRRVSEEEALRKSEPSQDYDRVAQAMDDVEAAQRLLEKAGRELSPIPGYADEWSEIGKAGGTIRDLWHTLEGRRTEIAAQTLRLGEEDGGPRYFLAGRPVHAGNEIELDRGRSDGWERARFEWTHQMDDPPMLVLRDGSEIPLPESTDTQIVPFRWPN